MGMFDKMVDVGFGGIFNRPQRIHKNGAQVLIPESSCPNLEDFFDEEIPDDLRTNGQIRGTVVDCNCSGEYTVKLRKQDIWITTTNIKKDTTTSFYVPRIDTEKKPERYTEPEPKKDDGTIVYYDLPIVLDDDQTCCKCHNYPNFTQVMPTDEGPKKIVKCSECGELMRS